MLIVSYVLSILSLESTFIQLSFPLCGVHKVPNTSKESDTKLLQSINFAYEVGIISSYSNRICHRRIAKSHTKDG